MPSRSTVFLGAFLGLSCVAVVVPLGVILWARAIESLPSEELAWKHFSREILPQIEWTTSEPPTTDNQ